MDVPKGLTPARLRRGILTEVEIEFLAQEIARTMGPMGPGWAKLLNPRSEALRNHFRYASVAQRCRDARAERGLSVRETAAALKLPQYKIKAIEAGDFREFRLAQLQQYVNYFGFSAWLRRWCKANPALVASLSAEQ